MDKPRHFKLKVTTFDSTLFRLFFNSFVTPNIFKNDEQLEVIEYSAYEQLKKENLLLSDDRELYMRHREILIGALNTIAFEGSSREYCTKISEQALKEIGEI
jgi:hypothetical protein